MDARNYSKVKPLGKGTYGTVYVVRERSGALAVMKEVPLRGLPAEERRTTLNEVEVLRRLRHNNIVQYYNSFVDSGHERLCIIMEYCNGGDLFGLISQHRDRQERFSADDVLSITLGLVRALSYWCAIQLNEPLEACLIAACPRACPQPPRAQDTPS